MPSATKGFFKRFTRGLGFKLGLFPGLLVFIAMLMFTAHGIKAQETSLLSKMSKSALRDCQVVKAALCSGTNGKDNVDRVVKAMGHGGPFPVVNLYDSAGVVRYSSGPGPASAAAGPDMLPVLKELAEDSSVRTRMSQDGNWLDMVDPVLNGETCSSASCHGPKDRQRILGAVVLRIPLDWMGAEIFDGAKKTFILALFLSVATCAVVVLSVGFMIKARLKILSEQAASLGHSGSEPLEPMACLSSEDQDELSEVERAFDQARRNLKNSAS